MKLTSLDAHLIRVVDPMVQRAHVEDLDEAQGVMFLCPVCVTGDRAHYVCVWFADKGVDEREQPLPRWKLDPSSTGLQDLTVTPSIHLLSGCQWHGWVKNGDAA